MNVMIVVEWMWRERSIADAAHPGRMLVMDNVGSRARPNWGSAPAANIGG